MLVLGPVNSLLTIGNRWLMLVNVSHYQWHRKDFLIGRGGGGAQHETTYRVVSNLNK